MDHRGFMVYRRRVLIALVLTMGGLLVACQTDASQTGLDAPPVGAVPSPTIAVAPTESPTVAASAGLAATPPPAAPLPMARPGPTVGSNPQAATDAEAVGLRVVGSARDGALTYYIDEGRGWSQIWVDRGDGPVLAMADEQDRFLFGEEVVFDVSEGIVRFRHESSGSYRIPYVGRLDDGGIIRDLHRDTGADLHSAFLSDASELQIDREHPLIAGLASEDATINGWWYRGRSLGAPACGATTLYADDADGYRRVLTESVELDTVVAVHASAAAGLQGADASATSRSLIFATECPGQYEGVRLMRGAEHGFGGEGSPAPGLPEVWVDDSPIELPGGRTEVRRVVDFYDIRPDELGSFIEVLTVEHLTGEIETFSIDDYGETIVAVQPGHLADRASVQLDGYVENPLGVDRLIYPYANELLPDDFALRVDPTGGGPTVVVLGYQQVQVLDPNSDPVVTHPAEIYGENAFPSAVVAFGDSFIIAIGGEEPSSPLLPELMRWSSGANMWIPITTTVTRPASYASAATSSAATPPSPPFAGAAGITDLVVYHGTIWATGWTTSGEAVRSALWMSTDGANWTLELLPARGEGVEYGQSISVNDLGVMVTLGNWTHFGAGILARPHGGDWAPLPFPLTNDATRFAYGVASAGDRAWVLEHNLEGPDAFAWSGDLVEWNLVELPPLEEAMNDDGFPDGGFWSLDPDHVSGAMAWYSNYAWGAEPMVSTGWQWHESLARFIRTPVPGHYVGSTSGFVFTQQIGNFMVIELAALDQ